MTKQDEQKIFDIVEKYKIVDFDNIRVCRLFNADLILNCDECEGLVICDTKEQSGYDPIKNYIYSVFKEKNPEYFL